VGHCCDHLWPPPVAGCWLPVPLDVLSVRFVVRRYRSGEGLVVGVSPKLIKLRSGVEEEVKNVDTGRSPDFSLRIVLSVPRVYCPVLEDAFDAEFEEAVEAEDEGA